MYPGRSQASLEAFFAGLAEQTFESRLGVADPSLVDYLANLLTRFVRNDALYRFCSPTGKRLRQLTELLVEAEARVGEARREVHRHIGDFTLFWTGVYPEALPHLQADTADRLLDFSSLGKRAYWIAASLPTEAPTENDVLKRLSHEFELCQYGLGEVRREWERRDTGEDPPRPILFN